MLIDIPDLIYIIVGIIAIILIMAIIGFIMERKKLEKEHNEEIAHISNPQTETVIPIQPVNLQENTVVETVNISLEEPIVTEPVNNQIEFEQPEPSIINISQQEIKTITEINPIE